MNFCQVEAFIFECIASLLFAFDNFNQSNVFRKLGYIVGIQKGDCAIFGTTDSVSAILLLGHHGNQDTIRSMYDHKLSGDGEGCHYGTHCHRLCS